MEYRINRDGVKIGATGQGRGPTVVLLPSLGRGGEDFDDLAKRLADAGFHAVTPEPRGIGGSSGPMSDVTMHDLAQDIAWLVSELDLESDKVPSRKITVVGHAFGNRVARSFAADYPKVVDKVVLIAAGGKVPIPSEIREAMGKCLNPDLPDAERIPALQAAFLRQATILRFG